MKENIELYTVKDIAQFTSMTTRTILSYIKSGVLQGRKIGGQWRFTKEDVVRFMDGGEYREKSREIEEQTVIDFINCENDNNQFELCTICHYDCNSMEEFNHIQDTIVKEFDSIGRVYEVKFKYVKKRKKVTVIAYSDKECTHNLMFNNKNLKKRS